MTTTFKMKQLALRNNGVVHKVHPTRRRTHARVKQWRAAFLRSLAKSPSVTIAARSAGVSTRACYKAKDADPVFAELWSDAINKSVDTLEHEVFQRALKGDAQLALAVLKAFRPERWRERIEAAVAAGVIILPAKQQGPE